MPAGRAVYTGMLNERGGYEADVTVTRLAPDRYLLVTSSASVVRDRVWIERHTGEDEHVVVVDVSSAYAVYGVMGPRSRDPPAAPHPGGPLRRGLPLRHQPGDRPRLFDGPGHPDHLRGGAGLGALRAHASSPSASTRPCSRPGPTSRSPAPATTPSTRCAWTRGTGPSARTSPPTTIRWRPGCASPASWRPTIDFIGRSSGGAGHRRRAPTAAGLVPAGRSRPDAVGGRAGPPATVSRRAR